MHISAGSVVPFERELGHTKLYPALEQLRFIIFVTALPSQQYADKLIELRISGFVTKPYEPEKLEEEFDHLHYPVTEDPARTGAGITHRVSTRP